MLQHRTVHSLLLTILLCFTAAVWTQPALAAQSDGASATAGAPLFQAAPLNPDFLTQQTIPGFMVADRTVDGLGLGGRPTPHVLYSGSDT